MRSRIILAILAAASLNLIGCLPIERISWSPDASKAVVVNDQGQLYLCDQGGKMSAGLAEGVRSATWFGDSKHLAIVRSAPAKTWDEIKVHLGPAYQQQVITMAKMLKAEIMEYKGDWNQFPFASIPDERKSDVGFILVYLRDKDPQGVKEKVGEEMWKKVESASPDVISLETAEVAEMKLMGVQEEVKGAFPITDVTVAPSGKMIACTTSDGTKFAAQPSLYVVTVKGGKPRMVAEQGSAPAWSPDGTELAFIQSASKGVPASENGLGSLVVLPVTDKDGRLPEKFEGQKEVASLLTSQLQRLYWLKDGRFLFNSPAGDFPRAAGKAMVTGLFIMPATGAEGFTNLLPKELSAEAFRLSPDQKRVLLSAGEKATIVTLDGQKVDEISVPIPDKKSNWLMPVWRGNDQVCFGVPAGDKRGSAKRPEIVLYTVGAKDGKCEIISKDWPDGLLWELVGRTEEQAKAATQAASQPASAPATGEAAKP